MTVFARSMWLLGLIYFLGLGLVFGLNFGESLKVPFRVNDVLPALPRQISWPVLNNLHSAVDSEERIIDSKALRKRIFYGGVDPGLRKEVWPFLLGYHAYDSTSAEREYLMSVKKSEYEAIKNQWQSISREQAKSFTKFRERKGLIDEDVVCIDLAVRNPQGSARSIVNGADQAKRGMEMKSQGIDENRLRLLRDVSGAFRPGILTALVGVSGAGKTTLMDVLAGRKTGGYIEGNISISAAAIVMRTVRNTVDTGRTVVCTIHQPSIDIFEAFDELLLMKRGGNVIYAGPLGRHSHKLVEYFEAVPGLPKITEGYNPTTWMLDVSSTSVEAQLDVDFAEIYANSGLYQNQELIKGLSTPAPGTNDLYFPTKYSQSFLTQCLACFWKQHWSYWRNSQYNAIRFFMTIVIGIISGVIFLGKGSKMQVYNFGIYTLVITFVHQQQDLLLGATYSAVFFLGASNANAVQIVVAVEKTVFYRERAAGMYSELLYAFAQVAIETIYVVIQTFIYALLLYSMIGFEWTVVKFFYFYYFIFMCFTYFSMCGMMVVALTPNHQIAAIVMSFVFSFWNLFSGFLIPRPVQKMANETGLDFSDQIILLENKYHQGNRDHMVGWVKSRFRSLLVKVSDNLLHDASSSQETLIVCSQTLRSKVQRDFEELPSEAFRPLRDLLNLIENISQRPPLKLEPSLAVAALAVHVPAKDWGDGGIINWLRDETNSHPECIPSFLELLRVLPER
ncbi:unnamed protein product [Camellia sinensis]